ncbi:uncharacterized protein MELLADRAFT_72818 [Melampsora larici-populina 98AG31]|uniref:G-protein coupled receptors family 1 profile domain-containing protein n=1 Tax=Melampsora larici-populina (strain 98AG31 / pathotype 3-4-7) TaxID=747676 RepID=F4RZ94_MELLP|nr:uncharacterized protein MELLADRAFT_72818 [Melampsora larici-populina 98AG31]EGG02292.1 hypothetical protein MELLADRAFT_72818 [Melampsora larici-populina 98AG31]
MIRPDETSVIKFVLSLPPTTNPYSATADYLESVSRPCSTLPIWSRWLIRLVLLSYVLMFFQTARPLYIRIKTRKFDIIGFNTLNLIKIDTANHLTAGYLLYSTLSIINLIWRDLSLSGYTSPIPSDFIDCTKSLVSLTLSWLFLWICISHSLLVRWKPLEEHPLEKARYMSPKSAWLLNGGFFVTILWPYVPVIFSSFRVVAEETKIVEVLKPVIIALRKSSHAYSPSDYNTLGLLSTLIPGREAFDHADSLVVPFRIVIFCYLISASILCIAYPPILLHTFKGMNQSGKTTASVRSQKGSVVIHSFLAFTSTLWNVPILIWTLEFQSYSFIYDSLWWTMIILGIDGILAITGNIIIFLTHSTAQSGSSSGSSSGSETCSDSSRAITFEDQKTMSVSSS